MKKTYKKPEGHLVECKIDRTLDWKNMSEEEIQRELEKSVSPDAGVFYQRNSQYILREIADEIVLVPTGEAAAEFNGLVNFNKTSAFLWSYLQKRRTAGDVVFAFAREYGLSPEQSEADVKDFLKITIEHGLVMESREEGV